MYHPRLRDAHSPLTPIPPMSQSSFDFSPEAIALCLEASKSTTPSVLKSRRSYTPMLKQISPPNISPIDFLVNDSTDKHLFASPCLPTHNCTSKLNKDSPEFSSTFFLDSAIMPLLIKSSCNINDKRLNVNTILEDCGLEVYSSLFEINEIDLEVFVTLNDDELKEIEVNNESHRAILLNEIQKYANI